MDTNSNESLRVYSFLGISDMKSNKYVYKYIFLMLESQFEIWLVYSLEDHQLMLYDFFKRTGFGP